MKTSLKCEQCNLEISGEKCVFAIYKRVIDGKEHYFCCVRHTDEYEKQTRNK